MQLYRSVPKDTKLNLEFRKKLILAGDKSRADARELWIASSRDMLFWINSFCWLYEPRPSLSQDPEIPFLTYDYQDRALLELERCIGIQDVAMPKSRDMGVSWTCLAALLWRWTFRPMQSFLLVSRTEEYVDKPGDPKALFWKLEFMLDRLPKWMKPGFDRVSMRLVNKNNDSIFNGSATHRNVARGDRRTAIMLDEFAAFEDTEQDMGEAVLDSTQSATDCRLFVSTPKGMNTAFYKQCVNPDVVQIKLHWTLHPHKASGLYYDAGGKPRSPWYDRECARANHDPARIAQELDIDHAGSAGGPFFGPASLDKIEKESVKPPVWRGTWSYDDDTGKIGKFSPDSNGPLKLWVEPKEVWDKEIQVVFGIDVSQGIGSSASTVSIINKKTGEKIGEYANANIRPEHFAAKCVALAKFMGNAFMVWDAGGPGSAFGARVLELYGNVYYHRREDVVTRDATLKPGYHLTGSARQNLLTEFRRALVAGEFTQRSSDALLEARRYSFINGKPEYVSTGSRAADTSGAGANHGDRVIADALAWHGMYERPSESEEKSNAPACGTYGHRLMQQALEAARESEEMDSLDF